jgi:uncharacterized small protein (DUF1192 family)
MAPRDPKDAEIERLKAEIHRLQRDLVDAVQNIQAHSMIVDASEKDAEIERLKGELEERRASHLRTLDLVERQTNLTAQKLIEIERLKRDLVDAVQNIQAHSMIVDASEKDAEIERLKAEIKDQMALIEENNYQKQLITELCDALEQQSCWSTKVELLQRAREATK